MKANGLNQKTHTMKLSKLTRIGMIAGFTSLSLFGCSEWSDKLSEATAQEQSMTQEEEAMMAEEVAFQESLREIDADTDGQISEEEWENREDPSSETFMEDKVTELDTDQDGFISSEEWDGPAEVFTKLDTDEDGVLSEEEFLEVSKKELHPRHQHLTRHFQRLDTDGDEYLSTEEFDVAEEIFSEIDTDDDSRISLEEFLALPKLGKIGREKQFQKLDANADGSISSDEWSRSENLFEKLDENEDGLISEEEFTTPQRQDPPGLSGKHPGHGGKRPPHPHQDEDSVTDEEN